MGGQLSNYAVRRAKHSTNFTHIRRLEDTNLSYSICELELDVHERRFQAVSARNVRMGRQNGRSKSDRFLDFEIISPVLSLPSASQNRDYSHVAVLFLFLSAVRACRFVQCVGEPAFTKLT